MRNRFVCVVGMLVLVTSGCFHGGYPYGNYGPGPSVLPPQPWNSPYGGQPGMQPQYPPNSNPIYMPGTNPTPLTVPDNSGSPSSDPPPTYSPPISAPPFNQSPSGTGPGSVPNPDDSDLGRSPGTSLLTPTSTSKTNSRTKASLPDEDSSPFNEEPSTRRMPRSFADDSVAESEFMQPVQQTAGSDNGGIQLAGGSKGNPFAHDEEFGWVQGTVDFDEQTSTWHITYNDNPPTSDPFGGEFTLAKSAELLRVRPNEVIRIAGYVDEVNVDALGKPLYQISKLTKLQKQ